MKKLTSGKFSKSHTFKKKSPASQIRTGDIAVTARVRQKAHEQTTAAHSIQAELRRVSDVFSAGWL